MTEPLDQVELVRELAGNRCQCGATKEECHTFCKRCHLKLPQSMCRGLYQPISKGYEDAYQAAIATLRPSD